MREVSLLKTFALGSEQGILFCLESWPFSAQVRGLVRVSSSLFKTCSLFRVYHSSMHFRISEEPQGLFLCLYAGVCVWVHVHDCTQVQQCVHTVPIRASLPALIPSVGGDLKLPLAALNRKKQRRLKREMEVKKVPLLSGPAG